jgi:hypothetical protein
VWFFHLDPLSPGSFYGTPQRTLADLLKESSNSYPVTEHSAPSPGRLCVRQNHRTGAIMIHALRLWKNRALPREFKRILR